LQQKQIAKIESAKKREGTQSKPQEKIIAN